MMTELISNYALFLAKTLTIVMAIGVVLLMVARTRWMQKHFPEQFEAVNLNEKYRNMAAVLRKATMSKKRFQKVVKAEKAERKREEKRLNSEDEARRRIFVINFHGDVKATEASELREAITAILMEAKASDEILIRLENAGGLVHEHGLAASQLARVRERKIPLTVAVDKVAASGGYLMACVADRIIAAPFAVLGSIGVLAQMPNFHRLLDQHGIDVEQLKAGELKRTLTMFGKNTEEDRARLQTQLDETHTLFRGFIRDYRPRLNVDEVATGEYWYGKQALDLKLIDALQTSDDYLMQKAEEADIFEIRYSVKKRPLERLVSSMQLVLARLLRLER